MDWSPFVPHAAEGSPPRDIPARCCALHEAHAQACWCACMRHRQVGFPAEGVPFMGCRANGGAAASPWGKPNPKAGIGAASQAAEAAAAQPSAAHARRSPDHPAARSRLVRCCCWPLYYSYCTQTACIMVT